MVSGKKGWKGWGSVSQRVARRLQGHPDTLVKWPTRGGTQGARMDQDVGAVHPKSAL